MALRCWPSYLRLHDASVAALALFFISHAFAFSRETPGRASSPQLTRRIIPVRVPARPFPARLPSDEEDKLSSYGDSSGSTARGIVSSLTAIYTSLLPAAPQSIPAGPAPSTPSDLMRSIKDDYVLRNYLWTGDVELGCFAENCIFTDPTLSFEGRDTFVSNVQKIQPALKLLMADTKRDCDSILLDISLNDKEGYVETRWNMVGTFANVPWRPKIDVIGRTKFWYEGGDKEGGYQIYLYDEKWEVGAAVALLQLITPGS